MFFRYKFDAALYVLLMKYTFHMVLVLCSRYTFDAALYVLLMKYTFHMVLVLCSRYTFDAALDHIFLLMKKDSYARFLRSDHYKNLQANAVNPCPKKK